MNLFGKKSAEERFWGWVQDHAAQLKALKGGDSPLVQKFGSELCKVHRNLVFQMGRASKDQFDLEISADGIKEMIPVVEKLVNAAPKMPGIEVHAFRQRTGGVYVEFKGRQLSADSVFFASQQAGGKLNLWLYIDGLDKQN